MYKSSERTDEEGNREYYIHLSIDADRPDFRLVSTFLWGDNLKGVDSDGDSYNPASRDSTYLTMGKKDERFTVSKVEEKPLIFEVSAYSQNIAERVAYFLAKETSGQIIDLDGKQLDYSILQSYIEQSGFDLKAAIQRADYSIWRQSTLEYPYPNK